MAHCADRIAFMDAHTAYHGQQKESAGASVDRLVELLDRPRRGNELAAALGLSRQRVHQLVARLCARGRLRPGDQERILLIVARSDDPTLLLTRDEERILSALPDDPAVATSRSIKAATNVSAERVSRALARLEEHGLIVSSDSLRGRAAYRLCSAGRHHFQRRGAARRAVAVPPVVKSDRVFNVLTHLSDRGEARIREVREAVGVPQASINALMQYLKRRGLVAKTGNEMQSAYTLTPDGFEALASMKQSR